MPDLKDEAALAFGCVVLAELLAGGQKTVHKVEYNGVEGVLKVVRLASGLGEAYTRAEREVEFLETALEPNLVRVLAPTKMLGSPPQGIAWIEEFIPGDDLRTHLGSPWDPADTIQMIQDVSAALVRAHSEGVIHRDLSPGNIMRRPDGSFVVMDFGYARFLSRTGLTVHQPGTPGYASPEHLNAYSGGPTPASDVFTIGLLACEALTGAQAIPFTGDMNDYTSRLRRAAVALPTLGPDFSDLDALIRRCVHIHPARRYLNAGELNAAIGVVARAHTA